jgi:hypothetical protein
MRTKGCPPSSIKLETGGVSVKLESGLVTPDWKQTRQMLTKGPPASSGKSSPLTPTPKRRRLLLCPLADLGAITPFVPVQPIVRERRMAAAAERAALREAGNKYMKGWLGIQPGTMVQNSRQARGGRPSRFAKYWQNEIQRRTQLIQDRKRGFLRELLVNGQWHDVKSESSEASDKTYLEQEAGQLVKTVSISMQPFGSGSASESSGSCQTLLPPPRLTALMPSIHRCSCGMSSQRRSCRRFAEGRQEHDLLAAMNKQFTCECESGGSILFLACSRESDIHFIVNDLGESGRVHQGGCRTQVARMVVGYTVSQLDYKHMVPMNATGLDLAAWPTFTLPQCTLLLQQLWVEPDLRCRGVAKQSLSLLLAGHRFVTVECPTLLGGQ